MRPAACTAMRCWYPSPGLSRPARMRMRCTGCPVSSDSDSELRNTWPPPSPIMPSISIIAVSDRGHGERVAQGLQPGFDAVLFAQATREGLDRSRWRIHAM